MASITVRASAKVNLDLRVLHRRADGYHEIRTLFQELALHDTLSFTPARGPLRLSVVGDAPDAEDNIVWKTARALWRAAGRNGEPRGVSIHLVKRIPAQAGLGGGSSDAAAALRALNEMWKLGLTARDVFRIASGLGADVPFFLVGGTALGVGRGDEIYPLPDLPPSHIVVACPPAGVSTAEAYAALRRAPKPARKGSRELRLPWAPGSMAVANDFEAAVYRMRPEAARLRDRLAASGAYLAQLSGSGSAVYGLFERERDARRAVRALGGGPETRVWVTRFQRRRRRSTTRPGTA